MTKGKWLKAQAQKGEETSDAYITTVRELFEGGATEVHYSEIAEVLGKDAETVRVDLSSKRRKHKKNLEKEGYRYNRGVITQLPNSNPSN